MKIEQKSLRIGAAVILFAIALRVLGNGFTADFSALAEDFSLPSLL